MRSFRMADFESPTFRLRPKLENDVCLKEIACKGFSVRRMTLYEHAPISVPAIGPTKYTHIALQLLLAIAGPRDLAGFIDPPDIGPAKIELIITIDPTAIPASSPICMVYNSNSGFIAIERLIFQYGHIIASEMECISPCPPEKMHT